MSDDSDLINNIKNGIDTSKNLDDLHEMHSGIFYKILHQYIPDNSNYILIDIKKEISSEIKYHIYIAALEFKFSKKVKFATYLGNRVRWMCLNKINKLKDNPEICTSFLDPINVNQNQSPLHESNFNQSISSDFSKKEYFDKIFNSIFNQEDERIKKLFNMRYNHGTNNKLTPWRNISKKLNLSIQGCINIHNTFLKKIKKHQYDK